MGLPAALRSRLRPNKTEKHDSSSLSSPYGQPGPADLSSATLKQGTKMRKGFALSASFAYLLSWIFLLLVCGTYLFHLF